VGDPAAVKPGARESVGDLSEAAIVVDVGGGNGALLAALLQRYPTLSGLLFDQDEVVAGAGDTLAAMAGRVQVVGGSFFDRVPAGGDVYLLSQVLHDWDDQACRQILAAVRSAMEPGRRLMVIERLLEPGSGPLHYLSDINMMVNLHGRERSLDEFTQLLSETGFGAPTVVRTQATFSILDALSV